MSAKRQATVDANVVQQAQTAIQAVPQVESSDIMSLKQIEPQDVVTVARVNTVRQEVKARIKELEAKEAAIITPMKTALKAVQNLFKGPLLALEAVDLRCKNLIEDYLQQEREAALREAEKQAKKVARKDPERAECIREVALTTKPVAPVQQRQITQLEITNFSAMVAWCVSNNRYDLLEPVHGKLQDMQRAGIALPDGCELRTKLIAI